MVSCGATSRFVSQPLGRNRAHGIRDQVIGRGVMAVGVPYNRGSGVARKGATAMSRTKQSAPAWRHPEGGGRGNKAL